MNTKILHVIWTMFTPEKLNKNPCYKNLWNDKIESHELSTFKQRLRKTVNFYRSEKQMVFDYSVLCFNYFNWTNMFLSDMA